jgi:hypothetical protein
MVRGDIARVFLTPGLGPVFDHPFAHGFGVAEVDAVSLLAGLVFGRNAGIVDEDVDPVWFAFGDFGDEGPDTFCVGEVS